MSRIYSPDYNLHLPQPLLDVIRSCETNCVAGCCGLDAFDMDVEHILCWARDHDDQHLWTALEQLSEVVGEVAERRGQVVSDMEEFNTFWETPAECIFFLRTWQGEIARAIEVIARRPLFNPDWRTLTAVGLAEAIYAERAFDRLPILADALEDAGCDQPELLAHLRGPGPHVRGCWALDLVLGKA